MPAAAAASERRESLGKAEVVELADGGIPGCAQLGVGGFVLTADELRRLALRLGEHHHVAPGPEVAAPARPRNVRWKVWLCASTKPGSVRVAVTGADASTTILRPHGQQRRLCAPAAAPERVDAAAGRPIPVFVAVLLAADGGEASWPAGIIFGVAGVTDQVDGWLARRWRVESQFGKLADPLADRLMIDAAIVLLWLDGKLPWPGLAVILFRDVLLVGGYRLVVRAATSSRSHGSGSSRPGSCTRRSAACS